MLRGRRPPGPTDEKADQHLLFDFSQILTVPNHPKRLHPAYSQTCLSNATVKHVGPSFGMAAIAIAGFVTYEFARHGTTTQGIVATYGIAWLLLFSGIRVVLEHWDGAGDAQILQGQTKIVPVTFARMWLVGAIFALLVGARPMT